MTRTNRRRSLPVIALAVLALVVVAGTSGAVAGSMITSKQIKDDTILSRDIKNGAVKGADLNDATEAALRGRQGPAGRAGISDYGMIFQQLNWPANSPGKRSVSCPAGKSLLGGFAPVTAGTPDFIRYYGNTYEFWVEVNPGPTPIGVEAQLICATVS
jgi:hypothetical protein